MGWQSVITLLIVLFAMMRIWLEIRRVFMSESKSVCGGCQSCPSETGDQAPAQLVSLEINPSTDAAS